jgi:hypothetical protein
MSNRQLSYTEIEAIIARVIRQDDVFVMVLKKDANGFDYVIPGQMELNHFISEWFPVKDRGKQP